MNPWSTRARRFRVGLLVLGCALLFTGMVAFVVGGSFHENLIPYEIAFRDSVKGMVVGSKVNFQGVPIGTVSDIRFKKGDTLVTVRVDPAKATIQTVTKARLDRLLVTGQVTVELEGYEEGAKVLPEGGVIATASSAIDQLTRTLPEIMGQAGRVLDGLELLTKRLSTLLSEQNLAAIDVTLLNLERSSVEIPRKLEVALDEVPNLSREVQRTLTALRSTTHDVGELVRREDVGAIVTELRTVLERYAAVGAILQATLDEAHGALEASRPGLVETLHGAGSALAEVQRLARELRLQPAALLYGRKLDPAAAPPKEGR